MFSKEQVEALAIKGGFLPQDAAPVFSTLDGKDVAAWLESLGFKIKVHFDTGRNGLAVTEECIAVSTNGYVYKD